METPKHIESVTPVGFNIKIGETVYFDGRPILAPLPKNILLDMQENPARWKVTEKLVLSPKKKPVQLRKPRKKNVE